ncbi:unnamed protein product [Meloidogyne enterolobii]|uniref:Uncharacterized protein n=1 Tax=Meloidogyne enterolobii TaxID=390850 RepID=A0ACB0YKG3_MELEN
MVKKMMWLAWMSKQWINFWKKRKVVKNKLKLKSIKWGTKRKHKILRPVSNQIWQARLLKTINTRNLLRFHQFKLVFHLAFLDIRLIHNSSQ